MEAKQLLPYPFLPHFLLPGWVLWILGCLLSISALNICPCLLLVCDTSLSTRVPFLELCTHSLGAEYHSSLNLLREGLLRFFSNKALYFRCPQSYFDIGHLEGTSIHSENAAHDHQEKLEVTVEEMAGQVIRDLENLDSCYSCTIKLCANGVSMLQFLLCKKKKSTCVSCTTAVRINWNVETGWEQWPKAEVTVWVIINQVTRTTHTHREKLLWTSPIMDKAF